MDFTGCRRNFVRLKYKFSHDLQGAIPEQTTQDRSTRLPTGAEGLYRVFVEYQYNLVEGLESQRICVASQSGEYRVHVVPYGKS